MYVLYLFFISYFFRVLIVSRVTFRLSTRYNTRRTMQWMHDTCRFLYGDCLCPSSVRVGLEIFVFELSYPCLGEAKLANWLVEKLT
jgi:hypothetical protein